ncbi:MAG: ATP-binding protein [Nitrospinota bacterium]
MGTKSAAQEKRQHPRFRMALPCRIEGLDCVIQDVSVQGLRLSSAQPLPVGTTRDLVLRTRLEDGSERVARVTATTRWCRPNPAGGYFLGMEVSAPERGEEAEFLSFLFHGAAQANAEKETELIELENYRDLVEKSGDPILVVQDGVIVFSNPAVFDVFGFLPAELKGLEFSRLVLSGSHSGASAIAQPTLAGEGVGLNAYTLRKADGQPIDVEIRSRPILYHNREASLSVLRDLTERGEFERMLVQVERLKVLGELSAGIAHDVNNSMMSILGAVELARLNQERTPEALRLIAAAAQDGATTIRRIQDFSRLREERNFVAFDVSDIVSDAKLLTRPIWQEDAQAQGRTIRIVEDLAEGAFIQGNASDVRQTVINLILNAVDAMPQGGEIGLTTEVGPETVTVSVRDTGVGIPEDVRDKIFDPFFSTKGERGSGLGLSTVYGMMAKHDGSVALETAENEGTTIRLRFPRSCSAEPAQAEPEPSRPTASLRLLVVDDDPKVLGLLSDLLDSLGHTAITANNGEEGLLRFQAERPDVVLTNLSMPGMNGLAFAKRVKVARPEIPIILITGWIRKLDESVLEESGIRFVMMKPFGGQEVTSMLNFVTASTH